VKKIFFIVLTGFYINAFSQVGQSLLPIGQLQGNKGNFNTQIQEYPLFSLMGFPYKVPTQTSAPSMVSNPWAWWVADTGITLNVSTVSAWQDKVLGVSFIQNTALAQPTYVAANSIFNGRPYLSFGSSSITMSAGDTLNLGSLRSMTIVVVCKMITTSQVQVLSKANASIPTNIGGYTVSPQIVANATYFQFCDTTGTRVYSQSTAILSGEISVNVINRDVPNISSWTNYLYGATTITNSKQNLVPTDALTLNTNGGGNFYIMEIIYYNRALTIGEIGQTISYAKYKYRL